MSIIKQEFGWKRHSTNKHVNIFEEIENVIKKWESFQKTHYLKIIVGCDSQVKGKKTTYTTCIALYREGRNNNPGKGASVFFKNENFNEKKSIRERMILETAKSIDVAIWLNKFLEPFGLDVNEIHCDINSKITCKSNAAVKECLGYINGMGFTGKIKPEAYIATKVADRKTK